MGEQIGGSMDQDFYISGTNFVSLVHTVLSQLIKAVLMDVCAEI